ncbi:hypothetical protein HMPREF4655_20810 [Helicobacter pylori 35A]|nr:hypothetical protein HMPREF4655_20749 [Helicobacter pylori 35A]ADU40928.1 hypothetical protein HMPREF4655_20810 [Helicobacter pylori 35A]
MSFLLKNISNSFYKGIGGYFAIIPPLTPLRYPPNPPRPLFFRKYHFLRKLFYY